MESLSFNVEDTTTWPNFAPNGATADGISDASLYPSLIEASISIRIIENHATENVNGTQTYRYNFDGGKISHIKEEREPMRENANYAKPTPPMTPANEVNTPASFPPSPFAPDVSNEAAYFASFNS
jgi:hypothetical protein